MLKADKRPHCCMPPRTIRWSKHAASVLLCVSWCCQQPVVASEHQTRSHLALFFTKYILKGPMSTKWCEVFVLVCKRKDNNWRKIYFSGETNQKHYFSDWEILFIDVKGHTKSFRLVMRGHNRKKVTTSSITKGNNETPAGQGWGELPEFDYFFSFLHFQTFFFPFENTIT